MTTVARLQYEGDDHLDKAIALAMLGISGPETCNVWQDGPDAIRFGHSYTLTRGDSWGWKPPDGWHRFPVEMTASEITAVAQRWLNGPAKYPTAPDTDGDVKMGFRVDSIGAFTAHSPELLVVSPHWTVYGK